MAVKFETGIDLRNQIATNAADASAATDLVTKQQLDAAIAGLSWKPAVRVATTANGTLATAFANAQTVDGIALVTGDRILIKNQTTQTENGIYVVPASGAPTRATDADTGAELNSAAVYVASGTTNGDKAFTQTTDLPITIGSTNIVWSQFGGGTLPVAGAGLTLTGSTLDVVGAASGGITVNADSIQVDSTVTRIETYATHASTTSIAITHTLGKRFIHAMVFITATGERIFPGEVATSTTVYTFTFGTAPTLNSLTFVLEG